MTTKQIATTTGTIHTAKLVDEPTPHYKSLCGRTFKLSDVKIWRKQGSIFNDWLKSDNKNHCNHKACKEYMSMIQNVGGTELKTMEV